MSRAFVKEDDAAPEPPLPERPISTAPNRVTARGAQLIRQRVSELRDQVARDSGDDAGSMLRRDLRYWQARLTSMQIARSVAEPDVVGFGCSVTIRRGAATSTVAIVGEDEADPASGLIAWTAPLARALEGAESGEVVALDAGGRREAITVLSIAARD